MSLRRPPPCTRPDAAAALFGGPSLGLADAELLDYLAAAEWVGIDAPFGWPAPMVAALQSYATSGRWPAPAKPEFRYRRTDLFVHDHVLAEAEQKLWPLSPVEHGRLL